MSFLRRGYANILCIIQFLLDIFEKTNRRGEKGADLHNQTEEEEDHHDQMRAEEEPITMIKWRRRRRRSFGVARRGTKEMA